MHGPPRGGKRGTDTASFLCEGTQRLSSFKDIFCLTLYRLECLTLCGFSESRCTSFLDRDDRVFFRHLRCLSTRRTINDCSDCSDCKDSYSTCNHNDGDEAI